MNSLSSIKKTLQNQKDYLAQEYGVVQIGIFGSYVRGEQRPDSDLDILIELTSPPKIGLMGLVGLKRYLSDLLGLPVDVALKPSLRKRIGQRILNEVQMI